MILCKGENIIGDAVDTNRRAIDKEFLRSSAFASVWHDDSCTIFSGYTSNRQENVQLIIFLGTNSKSLKNCVWSDRFVGLVIQIESGCCSNTDRLCNIQRQEFNR